MARLAKIAYSRSNAHTSFLENFEFQKSGMAISCNLRVKFMQRETKKVLYQFRHRINYICRHPPPPPPPPHPTPTSDATGQEVPFSTKMAPGILCGEGYFRYARAPSHQALSDTATKFNMAPDKEWSF